jgi:ABC-2 type transport system ATP-binding protein
MEIIKVNNLVKLFKVKEKKSFLKDLIKPEFKEILAVNNISFSVKKGEIVGFIGPNGAGKTTTIKMLSGILWPTSGEVFVNNLVPYKDRKSYVRNIGVVFGQRRSLWPELSVKDNIELIGSMYDLSDNLIKKRIDYLNKLIDISEFINQPFRKLSLGQQMKSELLASLIHSPKILFLDEPTIGMDIIAKTDFVNLLKKINQEEKCTIILTSHDLNEIEKLCKRIIIINKGKKLFDGDLNEIRPDELIVKYEKNNKFFEKRVNRKKIKEFLNSIEIENLIINEISLEDLIKKHYS